MPRPSPQDYNEAIQAPGLCFADPILRAGSPRLTSLGLPRPITGGFASVYQMTAGGRDWAVRCFLSEVQDQEARYAAVSAHLAAARLPYMAPFEFVPRGILVKGQWTPIVKMQWVQGVGLAEYVAAHLHQPTALRDLAVRWIEMVRALERAGIAHGDLQHGNVLVTNGALYLLDYDGMFVPALAGRDATEVGHRNYQHPKRTARDFDATLDRFSAWVVYIALLALSYDPSLWHQLPYAGDECLLFRREDFERPHASTALKLLTMHHDPALKALGTFFEMLLYRDLKDIPALSPSPLDGASTVPLSVTPAATRPSWLDDYVVRPASSPARGGAEPSDEGAAAWVFDHVEPATPREPHGYLRPPRWLRPFAAISLLVMGFAVVSTFVVGPSLLLVTLLTADALLLVNYVGLFAYYRREPAVVAYYKASAETARAEKLAASARRRIDAADERKERMRDNESRRQSALHQQRAEVEERERGEKARVQEELHAATIEAEGRRRDVKSRQDALATKHQLQRSPRINGFARELDALNLAELNEMSRTLQAVQEGFVRDYLRRARLTAAPIPGVRDAMRPTLAAHGIVTADDVDYYMMQRVPGLTQGEATALETWRQYRAGDAVRATPTRLDSADIAAIRQLYEPRRRVVQEQLAFEHSRLSSEIASVDERFRAERSKVDAVHLAAQLKAKKAEQVIVDRHAVEYARIGHALASPPRDIATTMRALDDDVEDGHKELSAHSWSLARARRDLQHLGEVSLLDYAIAVLLPELRAFIRRRRSSP